MCTHNRTWTHVAGHMTLTWPNCWRDSSTLGTVTRRQPSLRMVWKSQSHILWPGRTWALTLPPLLARNTSYDEAWRGQWLLSNCDVMFCLRSWMSQAGTQLWVKGRGELAMTCTKYAFFKETTISGVAIWKIHSGCTLYFVNDCLVM